jgi:SagB-type dehydrogenase family enzyme
MKVTGMNGNSYTAVRHYHEATKHHFQRMARSLGYMDWKNQPNPFRTYVGATLVSLPLGDADPELNYSRLYSRKTVQKNEIKRKTIGKFLELSMGLSAWKEAGGSRWALRINPSSGNLHPTEMHLLLPEVDADLLAGIYHYHPYLHALERRAILERDQSDRLNAHFGSAGFVVVLSSVFWREAWKYGERALRYCLLDTGHAVGALRFAAVLLGWRVTWLTDLDQKTAERLVGLDRTRWPRHEREHLEVVCWVHPANGAIPRGPLPEALMTAFEEVALAGTPASLSSDHHPWPIIEETAAHLRHQPHLPASPTSIFKDRLTDRLQKRAAVAIIRKRRSGVAFRADAVMQRQAFDSMLNRTLPRAGAAPFDNSFLAPEVHLLLFVHRVEGFDPGLYLLCRNPRDLAEVKGLMHSSFEWAQIDDALPLFRLQRGDLSQQAALVSCRQAIAGDSAFSLGMLARFDAVLRQAPWRYSQLFWEAGLIGQVLYLEAEAHGFRGTGIGCFFDDAVHQLAGLEGVAFQSLYHFTVGVPIEDHRLKTLAPYGHLKPLRKQS